jgi:sucrose-phosphate synthase
MKWLITDLDNTLIGDDEELNKFLSWYQKNINNIGFGIATGRDINSTIDVLRLNKVPIPQILITSVGSEIYYFNNSKLIFDKDWQLIIRDKWEPDKIKKLFEGLDFLTLQDNQQEHRVGYHIKEYSYKKIQSMQSKLKEQDVRYKLIVVERKFVDILPYRASKHKAIKYVCKKFGIHAEDVLVVGDSGNDRDMLSKMPKAVVVANHQKELSRMQNVYFSSKKYAGAILDGLSYYKIV